MALSKVESAGFLVGTAKGFSDSSGVSMGPGWLELMLTSVPIVGGGIRSVKNTIAPNAQTTGEIIAYVGGGQSHALNMEGADLSTISTSAVYGAAKTGFFMGLGYSFGYIAGQFVTK